MSARPKLWEPSPQRARAAQMHAFLNRVANRHQLPAEWAALYRWSIEHRDRFWAELLEFVGVVPSRPCRRVVTGQGLLGTRWFDGMALNYARHLLRGDDDRDAILFENELGRCDRLTGRQLRDEVARCADALGRVGVQPGDRVGGYLPNLPETVIAMLAAASLGAAWSSCSPDFGAGGVFDRFGQIEPTVLVAADGYTYGGRRFELLGRVRAVLEKLPSVQRVVIVPYLDEHPDISGLRDAVMWREFLGPAERPAPALRCVEVPFDHPLFIMYSSGTTGVPKCIVHGHGGTLLQHMKELMLHTDLRRGERIFYFTTCGWMMWNWLVSALGVGAAVVLYEGNPLYPTPRRLWEMAERLRINVFGTSPKFIAACQKAALHPGREHDLSALRAVLSTGSPLSEEQFRWVYDEVKADLQLSSISGGTDIISCFMLGNPLLPVYAGEIQCRGLGMDVQAWDEAGRSVIGQKGELVCCSPFPSQPVGFWNDPDGSRYRAAYFEHEWKGWPSASAPGDADRTRADQRPDEPAIPRRQSPVGPVWRHGDFIEITAHGGVIVYGRSDATLNPGGVRIGTAEIYRIVEALPEVLDSIAVGKRADDDVEIALFVVLREGLTLTDELARRIRAAVAAGATKRHVPRHIRQVGAIPRTISGKKVELAVQQIIHGRDVANRDALANPEALEEFRDAIR